ncbi:TadE/TadG family type IV pilus assembly protein [Brevundimonas fontaquae]|uniref:Pilus assembly protein n=1 Tax=Brevundimonas fontaquae TaxID=2813778 RepID=A0ABX7LRL3_9CAUL|nr:TadE/TadG family type IV pilus assembly protein [Brevundimonas fontaquae]QSF54670.1 pilus assembly protein [Brevundimonas fontaquae]
MNASTRIEKAVRALRRLAIQLASDRRGNVVMIFALVMPALIMLTLGGIDINRVTTAKARVQDALDAATLAAARSSYTDPKDLKTVALVALKANLRNASVEPFSDDAVKIELTKEQVVIADIQVQVKTLIANVVLPPYGKILDDTLPVSVHSEVNRSSKDIEVSLVLDITGSMGSNNRIGDLKNAANQLIKLVVQPAAKQTPYYSRMAIVPYSIGVNLGARADAARGASIGSTSITGASWAAASAKSISGITRASPGVVTANSHGLATNDYVWISGVSGMTQINNRAYRVVRIDSNKVSLQYQSGGNWYALNTSSGYSSYSSGGQIRKCTRSDCFITITSNNHGLSEDEGVQITGVNGMSALNNNSGLFEVYERTSNDAFVLPVGGAAYADYSNGGSVQCGRDGCVKRVFRDPQYNRLNVFDNTSCVSERAGSSAYTDTAPGSAYVGRNYASPRNPCPAATIQPLTSNIDTLTTLVNGLSVTGSTAGQIGLAWGWYTVSNQFNGLWSSNPAAAYAPTKVLKAVILMTDGEFNTPYCGGVIARNAGSGSGSLYDKIACDATNGDPFDQAAKLCAGMKAKDVIVYTVGFSITPGSEAANILSSCATDKDKAFLPQSGADLSNDFQAIGRDITRLRISR